MPTARVNDATAATWMPRASDTDLPGMARMFAWRVLRWMPLAEQLLALPAIVADVGTDEAAKARTPSRFSWPLVGRCLPAASQIVPAMAALESTSPVGSASESCWAGSAPGKGGSARYLLAHRPRRRKGGGVVGDAQRRGTRPGRRRAWNVGTQGYVSVERTSRKSDTSPYRVELQYVDRAGMLAPRAGTCFRVRDGRGRMGVR